MKATYDRLGRCVIAVSEGIHDASGAPIITKLASQVEHDAHGNVQLSGTGALADLLCEEIKGKLGIKRVRGDTFGYLQRSFLGCVSDVDQREAREVGEKAVQYAMWGDRDGSVAIKRTGNYAVNYELAPLETVAGKTRVMEDELLSLFRLGRHRSLPGLSAAAARLGSAGGLPPAPQQGGEGFEQGLRTQWRRWSLDDAPLHTTEGLRQVAIRAPRNFSEAYRPVGCLSAGFSGSAAILCAAPALNRACHQMMQRVLQLRHNRERSRKPRTLARLALIPFAVVASTVPWPSLDGPPLLTGDPEPVVYRSRSNRALDASGLCTGLGQVCMALGCQEPPHRLCSGHDGFLAQAAPYTTSARRAAPNLKLGEPPVGQFDRNGMRRDEGDPEPRDDSLLDGLVRTDLHADIRREACAPGTGFP